LKLLVTVHAAVVLMQQAPVQGLGEQVVFGPCQTPEHCASGMTAQVPLL
jgi:hypothetical protein